jgi:response regulator of citrate/malate metabolism
MKVLIAEDEKPWQEIIAEYVEVVLRDINEPEEGILISETYQSAKNAIDSQGPWNLLIADITLDSKKQIIGKNYGQLLITRAYELKIPTIVVSGTISVSDAGAFCRQYGVVDCFSKKDFASFETIFMDIIKKTLLASQESGQNTVDSEAAIASINRSMHDLKRGYFLSIGIAKYSAIKPLKKAVTDASDMARTLLNNGYTKENCCLLTDQDATKAKISDALNWLAASATADDTVVIFFSGHGLRRIGGFKPGEYLCPVDTDVMDLENTCISSTEFTNALKAIRAGRLVVLIDSCHSGGVGETKAIGTTVKSGLSEDTYNLFAKNTGDSKQGRVIIASCKSDEVSWELPEMDNGLFTHYLLEGLHGEAARLDGKVPIMRLFEYVSDRVSQHRAQHPIIKADSENFIVAISRPQ